VTKESDIGEVLAAVELARRILGEYIAPGPRNATDTVDRLIDILDDRNLVAVLDRVNRRRIIRLVE
jgi:hypothetical protein